jgi:regulator of protease activity HflC (stomatin/prohibitin superfamily)
VPFEHHAIQGTIGMRPAGDIVPVCFAVDPFLPNWIRPHVRFRFHSPPERRIMSQHQYSGKLMLTTFMAALAVLALLYVMIGVKIVRQGYRYTIEHFGRFVRVGQPGFNFVPPFFYRVGRRINMMEQVVDIPGQEIITKDNAMVAVDGVVFFQVIDAAKAAYEVSDLYSALMALSTTNLRTVMGSMDLDETLSKRDEINARLLAVVDHATEPWGVKITRVELKDIRPPQDIVNAMTRQMKAEREKRASILESEGMRQSEILRAEGEKQARILQAEGQKEAAFRDAEARERSALAEANATKSVSDAIEGGSTQAINYFIAQKYVEALGKFATSPNAKTILFPVEATQLMGTLGGIGELAREAFGEGSGRTVPAVRAKAVPSVPESKG